jgi:hypothetical protein
MFGLWVNLNVNEFNFSGCVFGEILLTNQQKLFYGEDAFEVVNSINQVLNLSNSESELKIVNEDQMELCDSELEDGDNEILNIELQWIKDINSDFHGIYLN